MPCVLQQRRAFRIVRKEGDAHQLLVQGIAAHRRVCLLNGAQNHLWWRVFPTAHHALPIGHLLLQDANALLRQLHFPLGLLQPVEGHHVAREGRSLPVLRAERNVNALARRLRCGNHKLQDVQCRQQIGDAQHISLLAPKHLPHFLRVTAHIHRERPHAGTPSGSRSSTRGRSIPCPPPPPSIGTGSRSSRLPSCVCAHR